MCCTVLYSMLEKSPKYGSVLLSKLQRKTLLVIILKANQVLPSYFWYYPEKLLPLNITKRTLQLKKILSCFLKTSFHYDTMPKLSIVSTILLWDKTVLQIHSPLTELRSKTQETYRGWKLVHCSFAWPTFFFKLINSNGTKPKCTAHEFHMNQSNTIQIIMWNTSSTSITPSCPLPVNIPQDNHYSNLETRQALYVFFLLISCKYGIILRCSFLPGFFHLPLISLWLIQF